MHLMSTSKISESVSLSPEDERLVRAMGVFETTGTISVETEARLKLLVSQSKACPFDGLKFRGLEFDLNLLSQGHYPRPEDDPSTLFLTGQSGDLGEWVDLHFVPDTDEGFCAK